MPSTARRGIGASRALLDNRRALGIALVIVSACGFGSGALFAKPAYEVGVDWLTLLAWRFLFGAALSWAWVLARSAHRAALRRLSWPAVVVSLALGVLYVGNSGTYFAALETVPASLAALIVYIYPAVVAVLSLRFGRRLVGARAWFALALALLGVVFALGGIDSSNAPPATGIILTVASPLIYACWIVLSARLGGERSDRLGSETDEGAHTAVAAAFMMSATAAAYWIGGLTVGHPLVPAAIPTAAWPSLVGVGVVSTFLAIQTFYAGAKRIGAAQAALVSTVEPLYTIGLAAILFGERLGPVQLLGGALIIAGVLIAQTAPSPAPRPALRVADE